MGQNANECRRLLQDAIHSVSEAIQKAEHIGDTEAERAVTTRACWSILRRLKRVEYHLGDRIQCGKANG